MKRPRIPAVGVALVATLLARPAAADDLAVLCSSGLKAVADDLIPKFEREAKHRINVIYGLAASLTQRIEGGGAFDVAMVTPAAMDDLIAHGKIAGDSQTAIARSGLALEIRAGAPKPMSAASRRSSAHSSAPERLLNAKEPIPFMFDCSFLCPGARQETAPRWRGPTWRRSRDGY